MTRWMLIIALALSGSATVARSNAYSSSPMQTQIMALPTELNARFHQQVVAGQNSRARRFELMMQFVFDAQGLGMSYDPDASHTVAESYATRKANCLGFTLLFLALAREADLDAYPQEISETLSWREQDGTLFRSSHVNVGVRVGARVFTLDVARDAVIARARPERISDSRLLAHYYNNLAIALLGEGQYEVAQQHMGKVLALDPNNASHWSNSGVLHLRVGDLVAAERAYAKALALDARHTSALFNMVSLAYRNGDKQREDQFRRRLVRVQQKDPFHHFLVAMEHERAGDYARAIEHYQRAIRWHRDEHRFHFALARAYQLAGDDARAQKALARARELSDGATQAAYLAKWRRLHADAESG